MSLIIAPKIEAYKPILADLDYTILRLKDIVTTLDEAYKKRDNQHIPSAKLFADAFDLLLSTGTSLSTITDLFDLKFSDISSDLSVVLLTTNFIIDDLIYDINKKIVDVQGAVCNAICNINIISVNVTNDLSTIITDISDDIYCDTGIKSLISAISVDIVDNVNARISNVEERLTSFVEIENAISSINARIDDVVDNDIAGIKNSISHSGEIWTKINAIDNLLTSNNGIHNKIALLNENLNTSIIALNDVVDNELPLIKKDIILLNTVFDIIDDIQNQLNLINLNISDIQKNYALKSEIESKLLEINTSIQNIQSTYSTKNEVVNAILSVNNRITDLSNTYYNIISVDTIIQSVNISVDYIVNNYAISSDVSTEISIINDTINNLTSVYSTKTYVDTSIGSINSRIDGLTSDFYTLSEIDVKFNQVNNNIGTTKTSCYTINENYIQLKQSFVEISDDLNTRVTTNSEDILDLQTKIARVYKPKGSCTWAELLTKSDSVEGDVWNVTDKDNENYVRLDHTTTPYDTTDGWDSLGKEFDLSEYAKIGSTTDTSSDNTIYGAKALANAKITANDVITAGTKCKITYDSKGLVTNGEDLVAADLPIQVVDELPTNPTEGIFYFVKEH